jgi:hypothetical protein
MSPALMIRLFLAAAIWVTSPVIAAEEGMSAANQMEFDVVRQDHLLDLSKVNQASVDLRDKYLAALQKRKETLAAAGNSKGVTTVEGAINDFSGGQYTEGIDPGGDSPDPEVAALGKVYLKEHQKLIASVKDRTIAVWKKYRQDLMDFGARLTKDGKTADASAVAVEVRKAEQNLLALQKAVPSDLPESQGGWDGVWEVVYGNHLNRRLKITQISPTELYIEAQSGWASGAKYVATYDAAKAHFIATHVEESGDQREESYILQSGRILMRHFHGKYPFEKPEFPAVAQKVKAE